MLTLTYNVRKEDIHRKQKKKKNSKITLHHIGFRLKSSWYICCTYVITQSRTIIIYQVNIHFWKNFLSSETFKPIDFNILIIVAS